VSTTGQQFWDLLTDQLSLEEYHRNQKMEAAKAAIQDRMRDVSTRALLSMRYDPPWKLIQRVVPEDLQRWPYWEDALRLALREVLATREHVPNIKEGKEQRRMMAQQHHGSRRLRKRD
jgi:hypothetical protein